MKYLLIFPLVMVLSNKPFHSDKFCGNPDVDIDYKIAPTKSKTGWVESTSLRRVLSRRKFTKRFCYSKTVHIF